MQNNAPDNQHINIIVNAECRAYLIYLYVCHVLIMKTIQAMTNTTSESQKIESTFVTMVKIEMLLSGNTFEVAKETVKQYLRSQGLM